jgi:hypothetical protein
MGRPALANSAATLNERVTDLVERVDYQRADSDEVREAVFRLRYDCYLRERAIQAGFEKRFTDPYDELGNTWIFGLHLDGKLVSSIRLSVATRDFPEMPAMWAFQDELMPLLDAGKIIIDPTRHVVDKDAAREYPNLVYLTMRLGWVAAEYFQADVVLATVRTEHQAFYRKVFGHRLVAPARPYRTLIKPLSLMTLDYFAAKESVNRRYPFFRSTFFERRMLFERLQVPELAEDLAPRLKVVASPPRAVPFPERQAASEREAAFIG